MNYRDIFEEIVSIMKDDSSTCKDMGVKDYTKYQNMIEDDMPRDAFLLAVQRYVSSFGVPFHLAFSDSDRGHISFSVARYEDCLYVTEAGEASDFTCKDKIIALDGKSIPEISREFSELLMDEMPERQGILWSRVLGYLKTATVERAGVKMDIPILLTNEASNSERYFYKEYPDKTLYLRLKDFDDEEKIRETYASCKEQLDSCRKLIIDVRGNGGGADTAFLPLLEYCFPDGEEVDSFIPASSVEVNYSKRNCDSRLQMLKDYFGDDVPEDVKPMVDEMIRSLTENRGAGFMPDTGVEKLGIKGRKSPEKVYIITDERCGSSGDAFVELMSYSPKVTVVGRPTMGITDYSNVSIVSWDSFVLTYPTSRDGRIDVGKGLLHKGVPVDIYIPWTEDSLEKDVELEKVLSM